MRLRELQADWLAKIAEVTDVAQQTTLVQGIAGIIEAISGIHIDIPDNIATKDDVTAAVQTITQAIGQIDLSAVAKQGTNPNVTLTTMDEKLGNVVMMTDAEYQPALDDLATKLD